MAQRPDPDNLPDRSAQEHIAAYHAQQPSPTPDDLPYRSMRAMMVAVGHEVDQVIAAALAEHEAKYHGGTDGR